MWQRLVEPVAEHVVSAMGNALPAEAQAMAGPLMGMLGQAGGAMFGTQVGQALGGLAGEVLSASDIGLPLGPDGTAALVPRTSRAFADGLDVSADDVLLYLALREAAHQRLFAHVPWLRGHLVAAVEDYGRGTTIDIQQDRVVDARHRPDQPGGHPGGAGGRAVRARRRPRRSRPRWSALETALALVEGWVDEVVGQATEPGCRRPPSCRRRCAAAGPPAGPRRQTFAALVGLELRPRRLRDASALWGSLRSRQGQEVRDAVWSHPDLLPTAADLDDPLGFREGAAPASESLSDDEFDAALADLLDKTGESGPDSPAGPTDT